MTADETREKLAAYAHAAWSGWMNYLFSKTGWIGMDEITTIPEWAVNRWTRQASLPYAEMPENEKGLDRDEADKILKIIQPYVTAATAEKDAEIVKLKAGYESLESCFSRVSKILVEERDKLTKYAADLNGGHDKAWTEGFEEAKERCAKVIDLAANRFAGGSWFLEMTELAAAIRKGVKG